MQAHDFKDHSSLLPCPFCGAAWVGAISGDRSTPNCGLLVYNNAPNSDTQTWAHVVCLDCGCGQSSIEKWQTRAPATEPEPAVVVSVATCAPSASKALDLVCAKNAELAYKWIAQDCDGCWWAYRHPPKFNEDSGMWACAEYDSAACLLYRDRNKPKNAAKTLTAIDTASPAPAQP